MKFLAKLFFVFVFFSVSFSMSQDVPTPTSTPTIDQEGQMIEALFLQKILKCPVFEDGGNTTEANQLFDYQVLSKRDEFKGVLRVPLELTPVGRFLVIHNPVTVEASSNTGSVLVSPRWGNTYNKPISAVNNLSMICVRPSNGIIFPGQFQPVAVGKPVTVWYPAFGIHSIHTFLELDQEFQMTTFMGGVPGSCTFTETTTSTQFGEYEEGIQLEYCYYHLFAIRSIQAFPLVNQNIWFQSIKWPFTMAPTPTSHVSMGRRRIAVAAQPAKILNLWQLVGGKCDGGGVTETNYDMKTRLEQVNAYWPNGSMRMMGTNLQNYKMGDWFFGYASGKKEAIFTYGEGETLQHALVYYETGKIFCEGNLEPAPTPDSKNRNETTVDIFTTTYWDSLGRKACVDKIDEDGNGEDLILYWPDGREAFEKNRRQDEVCDSGFFQMTGLGDQIFFRIDEEPEGWGNNYHCGVSMNILNSDLGVTKTLPDGPITLMVFGNIEENLFDPFRGEKPMVTATIKKGELSGALEIEPTSGMKAIFQFENGVLDGPSQIQDGYTHDYQYKKGKLVDEKTDEDN